MLELNHLSLFDCYPNPFVFLNKVLTRNTLAVFVHQAKVDEPLWGREL